MRILSLKKRSDFVSIAKNGEKLVTKGLVLQFMKRNTTKSQDIVNIGFTATKKLGNAVIRNRVKRRLRAAVAQIAPNHADNSYDYVVIGRKNTLDRDFTGLLKDLKYALYNIKENSTPSNHKEGDKT